MMTIVCGMTKMKRIDPNAAEEGPFPIAKDGLGELLAERAVSTMTSGDEPSEYNEDDALDEAELAAAGTEDSLIDEDEDDFDSPSDDRPDDAPDDDDT